MKSEQELIEEAKRLCEKFVNKVESGRARSKETYADCKAFLDNWEPEEPKELVVLSLEGLKQKVDRIFDHLSIEDWNAIVVYGKFCDKNGMRRRDLEFKPLIERIKDNWSSLHYDGYESLLYLVDNLKPLE